MGKKIACLGDSSSHGGHLVSTNQSGKTKARDGVVCVAGCSHSCPIEHHGTTSVSPVVTKTYVDGKLVITQGAQAGCGAIITPPDRGILVE